MAAFIRIFRWSRGGADEYTQHSPASPADGDTVLAIQKTLTIQAAGSTTTGIARAELAKAMDMAPRPGAPAYVCLGLAVDTAVDNLVDTRRASWGYQWSIEHSSPRPFNRVECASSVKGDGVKVRFT